MKTILKDKLSDKLVNAFLKNKIISAIPKKFTKKLIEADKFRKLCESKIKEPVIGYKAGGTGIPLLKKLNEKEPFYASVYARNFLKSGKRVRINKSTLGIESIPKVDLFILCLLYTSPSPRDATLSRMPSSA